MVPGFADWHPSFRTGPSVFSLNAPRAGGSLVNPATPPGVACRHQAISLLASAIGAAPWCRRPSPLGRDALPKSGTSASPARACGFACLWETLAKHRVYAGFRPCG